MEKYEAIKENKKKEVGKVEQDQVLPELLSALNLLSSVSIDNSNEDKNLRELNVNSRSEEKGAGDDPKIMIHATLHEKGDGVNINPTVKDPPSGTSFETRPIDDASGIIDFVGHNNKKYEEVISLFKKKRDKMLRLPMRR